MTGTIHLVTGEFPPDVGGVGDYSAAIARGLAATGTAVHVWCTSWSEPAPLDGVAVHRIAGWREPHFRHIDGAMETVDPTAPLLVQWVPHAFGRRSLNVGFCRWVSRRARRGQPVHLMVHEPFLAFGEGSLRQDVAAVIHRMMVSLLLRSAHTVWVSIPAWEHRLRPWTFGRTVPFRWLPVPSSVPVVDDSPGVVGVRRRLAGTLPVVVGHFGTYGPLVRPALLAQLPVVLGARTDAAAVLLGQHGDEFAAELRRHHPWLAPRVVATGALNPRDLSLHLQACDLLVQPYVDGVTTRHTTVMAGLAHGVPVVTTFGRDSEPLWHETGAVHLARPGLPTGIAQAALHLASDAGLRARLRDAGRLLYQTRFAVEHTIDALRSEGGLAA